MTKIAEAFVEISANLSPLAAGLNRAVGLVRASVGTMVSLLKLPFTALGTIVTAPIRLFGGLIRALTSFRGLLAGGAIGGAIAAITKAFGEQEKVTAGLRSVIRAYGEDVNTVVPRLERLAAGIQSVTTFGDEHILTMFTQAKQLGAQTDQLDDVTKAAIGLSAALGLNADAALRYIVLAQQGETMMLRRYIPALRTTTDATESLRIINELAAKGFQQHRAEADKTIGQFLRLKNAVGDLLEAIGGIALGGGEGGGFFSSLRSGVESLTDFLSKNAQRIRDFISELFEPIGKVLSNVFSRDTFSAVFGVLVEVSEFLAGLIERTIDGVTAIVEKIKEALNLDQVEGGFVKKLIAAFLSVADTIRFTFESVIVAIETRIAKAAAKLGRLFSTQLGWATPEDIENLGAERQREIRGRGRLAERTLDSRAQSIVNALGGGGGGGGGLGGGVKNFLDEAKKKGDEFLDNMAKIFGGQKLGGSGIFGVFGLFDRIPEFAKQLGAATPRLELAKDPASALPDRLANLVQSVQTATGQFKTGQPTVEQDILRENRRAADELEEHTALLGRIATASESTVVGGAFN